MSETQTRRRKRFSERDVLRTLILQGAHIPCGCGCEHIIKIEDVDGVIRDHTVPWALGGPDTPENCKYLLGPCNTLKTDGEKHTVVNGDKHKIAKSKRLAEGGRKRKGRNIQSRGFQKNLKSQYNRKTKRFETVRRT